MKDMNAGVMSIDSDGRTVWLNGTQDILARLCRISGEVWTNGRCDSVLNESYEDWAARVATIHKFKVPDHCRPDWAR